MNDILEWICRNSISNEMSRFLSGVTILLFFMSNILNFVQAFMTFSYLFSTLYFTSLNGLFLIKPLGRYLFGRARCEQHLLLIHCDARHFTVGLVVFICTCGDVTLDNALLFVFIWKIRLAPVTRTCWTNDGISCVRIEITFIR